MKMIKWGVLGTAYIFERDTAEGMRQAENCELYAIAGRSMEKAQAFKEKYGFQKAYGSYDELLADPEVEAVYVPMPNTLHKEWTIKALNAKKHVLCEKPMAPNAAEAAEMFAAINMEPEAAYARAVYDAFRAAGRRHLIDYGAMTVRGCCQTSQALGIYHDLFDEAEKPEAFRVLVQLIEDNDRLMDVGIIGNRALFTVLSRYGRTDLAYEMIVTDRFPASATSSPAAQPPSGKASGPKDTRPIPSTTTCGATSPAG